MKKLLASLTAASVVLIGAGEAMATPPVKVEVFSAFTPTGGGAPYAEPVGALQVADVMFATNTYFNWHPFGKDRFGADITGFLQIPSAGTYTFALNSDDGSLLYIDGALVVDNGGPHDPAVVSGSATLTPGTHAFEVQFFEDLAGPSGVDLMLPPGVRYGFAGTPGKPDCHGKSISALAQQFGGMSSAASHLKFPSVKALQGAVKTSCQR